MNRRDALKSFGVTATFVAGSTLPLDMVASSDTTKQKINKSKTTRVIVCGGGYGGLTTAKNLKKYNPNLEILLIEQNSHFMSCPYSNLYLGGVEGVSLETLSFDYLSASSNYGYEFINETIVNIDKTKKLLTTNNQTYSYDYLVLSTGIEYDYKKLFKDKNIAKKVYTLYPPAMKPGSEHLLLKKKLENFKGGDFVINVPSGTYRCPPAPYERACMVAYYFKQNNIKARVILLDPREKPGAKPKGFLSSFEELYKEYIVYMPNSEIRDINFEQKYLVVDSFDKSVLDYVSKKVYFEDANIIPNMKPSKLVEKTGLELTKSGWAKLQVPTFRSVSDEYIFVVGDSAGHPFPKSGHMANSCGYIVGKHIAYITSDKKFDSTKELPANICYSLVNGTPKEGISVDHSVSYDKKSGFKVSASSTPRRDKTTGETIEQWYKGITTDMFGI